MNVNKLVDLNRVKKRLDALDKDLFSELIIGHVRDELGGYINPGCLLLEERSKDSTDFEQLIADPSLYDPFIDQLNTTPENQYTGKRKILQLERPFRVLGWAERSERAFELTEMLLGISRVHGKGDDWEGLSREEFNEQFSKGSYVVGNTYSVTSEGTIHIDPQGMDDEIQRRVGVGVAVLEGVLNGEKDIKFRFLE